MVRVILGILVFLVLGLAGLIYAVSDPDIPAAVLEQKYGGPDSKFLTLPSGARVHYRDQGNAAGPVLVLLHGSNASLHTWEPWVQSLGDELRLVTLDLPAHGLTGPVPGDDYSQAGMAKFVLQVADALQISSFALGGNSMGGGVAVRTQLLAPDRVTRLVLVSAAGMPTKIARNPGLGFQIARTPVINTVMRWVSPRWIFENGLKAAIVDDALVTDAMVDRYWELNRREGSRAASLKRFQTPIDGYVAENAAKIAVPALILWGQDDSLTPVDMGEGYRKAIANAVLIVYPGTGHIAMEERPAETAMAVRAFMRGEPLADQPAQ